MDNVQEIESDDMGEIERWYIDDREVSESEAKNCIQRMFSDLGQPENAEANRPMSTLWSKTSPEYK